MKKFNKLRPKSKNNSVAASGSSIAVYAESQDAATVQPQETKASTPSDPPSENSPLNVISIESTSIENESIQDDDQQQPRYEELGSYSTFHDQGDPAIEHPTSYILQTDSSDEYSPYRRSAMEVADEEDNAETAVVANISPDNSSVYSSQATVRLPNPGAMFGGASDRFFVETRYRATTAPANPETLQHGGVFIDGVNVSYPLSGQTLSRLREEFSIPVQSSRLLDNSGYESSSANQTPNEILKEQGETPRPETVKMWDSAIPALLYSSTNLVEPRQLADNDLARQEIQQTLVRGNSINAGTDYLNVIKSSLSRNRSMKSNRFAAVNNSDSPPLLFSQDKNSMSRSMSTLRPKKNHNDEEPTKEPDENLYDDYYNYLDDDGESLVEGDPKYAAVTYETDLNCLKSAQIDPKFIKSPEKEEAELPSMFQKKPDEEPIVPKKPTNDFEKGDRRDKKSGDVTAKLRKVTSEKRYSIVIWILFMIIMCLICVFVPLLIIYSRGSDSVVERYLNNISPSHRTSLLTKLGYYSTSGSITPNSTLPAKNGTISNNTDSSLYYDINSGVTIAGISKFENFPLKYQRAEEMQEVMNSTKGLKNVFYGVDYAPRNVIFPICGATMHEVMLDVALLSQVTSRIRTYGTQCNQARMILDSIKTLNLNVSLSMGVWIGPDDDINQQQLKDMKNILKDYPRKHFESIYVGNEVLFREEQTTDQLIEYIKEAKEYVQNELKWDLPVGTSELGSKIDPKVLEVSDIFGSNTHPFFTGGNVQLATKWVYDFVKYQIEPLKDKMDEDKFPQIVISEIGWPYQGGRYKTAVAGKRHMQYFLNSWVCEAKQRDYPWFYFEAFDEPWKQVYHKENAKWETEWGLFTADRKLKEGITFPQC